MSSLVRMAKSVQTAFRNARSAKSDRACPSYQDLLGVEISQSTLVEAELTTEYVEGWSVGLADTYLNIISRWPDQFQVLLRVLEKGGEITREELSVPIYAYDESGGWMSHL